MQETVYLQFGNLANLAAVHFWNSQIAQRRLALAPADTAASLGLVDSAALFNFDTITTGPGIPRNVVFDRQSSESLEEYQLEDATLLIHKQLFTRHDTGSWRDYCFYHQPTVGIADPTASSFQAGKAFFEESFATREAAEEAIRRSAEHCDHLVRLSPIIDAAGWWGGYAGGLLEQVLVDEYPRVRIEALGLFSNTDTRVEMAHGLTTLAPLCHSFIPVGFGGDAPAMAIPVSAILDTLATMSLLDNGSFLPDGILHCSGARKSDSSPYAITIQRNNDRSSVKLDQSSREISVNLPIYGPVIGEGGGYQLEAIQSSTVCLDPDQLERFMMKDLPVDLRNRLKDLLFCD